MYIQMHTKRRGIVNETNNWPGYAGAEMRLDLPRWAFGPDEEDEIDGDLVFAE